jgi:hypothetical protein
MIGCAGPQTPEKFQEYGNLVAAPAFVVMTGPSATVFINTIYHTTVCYLYSASLDVSCQLGRQLGLWLPAWTPAWTIVSAWTVESYTSIPPHLRRKRLPRFLLFLGGVAPLDCLYKRRDCSLKAGSDERELGYSAEPYSGQR